MVVLVDRVMQPVSNQMRVVNNQASPPPYCCHLDTRPCPEIFVMQMSTLKNTLEVYLNGL